MDCMQQGEVEGMKPYSLFGIMIGVFLLLTVIGSAVVQPTAPQNITNTSQESPLPSVGANFTSEGGTITTMSISAITQNPHWKGFVGNVSGSYKLRNANNYSLYDWGIATITGEVYATRNSGTVNWDIIRCANSTSMYAEEQAINFTNSSIDRINSTFATGLHDQFYVGLSQIAQNSCPQLKTYTNSTAQSTYFQEILLYDETALVYTTLVNSTHKGFDNNEYHFQMIVPDYGNELIDSQLAYYFYVEII